MKTKAFLSTLAVLIVFVTSLSHHAWADADGFLGLKWGMSEEEAKKQFNDLELIFKRSEKRDVLQPWNGYVRRNESFKLGELPKEVTYYFSEKGFDGVTARVTFLDRDSSSLPGTYKDLKPKFLSS